MKITDDVSQVAGGALGHCTLQKYFQIHGSPLSRTRDHKRNTSMLRQSPRDWRTST